MAEATNEPSRLKTWWKGLKSEFKKISWPDSASVIKQTVAVIVVTVILGLIITILDMGLEQVVKLIIA